MKILKTLVFIIICVFINLNSLKAQDISNIVIGKKIKFYSKTLNEDREISISLPDSYQDNTYTKYPVLYLLDGERFFNSFSTAAVQMSSDASPQVPEMIIVGITSQNRVKDSSPTHSTIGYSGKKKKVMRIVVGRTIF